MGFKTDIFFILFCVFVQLDVVARHLERKALVLNENDNIYNEF